MAERNGDPGDGAGRAGRTAGHTTRLWRLRRNPLRRRSDLLEGWLRIAARLLLTLLIPAGCALTAASVAQQTLRAGEDLHRASAVLTEPAPGDPTENGPGWFASVGQERDVPVRARWTAPDGTTHTGVAEAPPGSERGARVTVWLDDAGRTRPRPPEPGEAWAGGVLTGLALALPAVVLVMGARGVLCARLDARRAEGWEREWAEVGPEWSRRHYGT